MLTGNKGEWSEIYAFLKLLSDKGMYAGDAHLQKVEHLFYSIIKIIRNDYSTTIEYGVQGDNIIINKGDESMLIPVHRFSSMAKELLNTIKSSSGAFEIEVIEAFMNEIYINAIKAASSSKSDITVVIYDNRVNQSAQLGFSIKSQLGSSSTLLNAGKTTNFIYKVKGGRFEQQDIDAINSIETKSKIKDRLLEVHKYGGVLEYKSMENDVFRNNLVLIDSALPMIISNLLLVFYTSNLSKVDEITMNISDMNPLGFDNTFSHGFYEYKVKRFLTDVALGMVPAKVWNGYLEATGGYIIVKADGDVLCYHIYNRNHFEEYLFAYTKFETGSSTRHEFGKFYFQEGELYIKLNLQIRFI